MRRAASLLLVFALLTACTRPAAKPPQPLDRSAPPGATTPGSTRPSATDSPEALPTGPRAESILPPAEQVFFYHLSDEAETATEYFIRDGERLTGTHNGKAYVTWFVTDQGIFRQDPQGPALLRYLPPVLMDGIAWKQQSGGAQVWFRLRRDTCATLTGQICWELTMLGGAVRTTFDFDEGRGVIWAAGENLANPTDSFEKLLVSGQSPTAPPARTEILKQMPTRPDGPLPPVTEVSVAEFDQAERTLLTRYGALLETDLNNDGKLERIEGRPGVWTPGPLTVYDHDGRRLELYGPVFPNRMQKLDVATVAGMDRPALLLQQGRPDSWHQIIPRWLGPKGLVVAYGWQPKISEVWGGDARVERDGTLVITGLPHLMAGYQWSRSFRVKQGDAEYNRYQAEPVGEQISAGPYPATPDDLVTAAFIARWWGLKADLARYVPDEKVREAFLATEVAKPQYVPRAAQTGKLGFRAQGYPEISPAPLGADPSTEFLTWVGQYEGGIYYAGRVTFCHAADGRLVITQLTITKSAFIY